GERVALNLLQRMSGVATLTAAFVKEVEGTNAVVVDTRKTTPGLRVLEKYSVRMGGGGNHRMALYDAVLIKENHVAAAGGITAAVSRAQSSVPHTQKIEV
ncbi:MAG: nicotinate-nucleotide diphosphorylase (carboxylating), partial [Gammaproteobacteria bacterium]|nr:nicotinate-nucleotide diphosphorylase (carboxylating) [Gammaproteobacteria bacterium]NIQ11626.1 nicotinate-nucleotide diphosphorylase (carboxylating) [Gammaproteobacteria bacterium]NIR25768.1 nicotinate-nucleotide diphosphorylase (carboxylating) [Gammaproteobacteria bacterium]NIS25005.1 nicotinate-nucleotide diphosphorylase (carboxylating) [candidate division KSB1 bacterium]NIY20235.1 nicotinate-nucleotide diphosphorylase (carboxylating) [Gammaproteobacteria bacterium]